MKKVVVGLGNPGSKYENTRHNIGWMVLDRLADRQDVAFVEAAFLRAAAMPRGAEAHAVLSEAGVRFPGIVFADQAGNVGQDGLRCGFPRQRVE